MKHRCHFVLLASLLMVVVPAQARLGETLSELQNRYGKPAPQERTNKFNAVWLLEGEDGALMYSVTFDAKGKSIAEGMKPVRYAKFTNETVRLFLETQLVPYRDSKTVRTVKPGEKYVFGGKEYTTMAEEIVVVDDANDLLLVWTKAAPPSVMAVRSVMMQ